MAKRKFHRPLAKKERKKSKLFLLVKLVIAGFLIGVLGVFFLFLYYARDLPRPEKFTEQQFSQSTKIYDKTGNTLLYEMYGEEKRTLVSLDDIPEHLQQAVIATEDANFYSHIGIDFRAIIRAVIADLMSWDRSQGASTIPQQLIRSTFLTLEKTASRKVKEIILALEISRRYEKDQILEWYLNQIPFGSNSYGVEAASQTFFNTSVSEISLAQSALLAALIQAPTYYSPYGEHLAELLARKDYVLDQMRRAGYLNEKMAEIAKAEKIEFAKTLQSIKAPHFVMYVISQLRDVYDEDFLRTKGLKVYTSLDWELQEFAEDAIGQRVEINKNYNAYNASLVSIEPQTGQILAMIGSKSWFGEPEPLGCAPGLDCLFDPKINVSINARQPGSSFKPFVYLKAFQKGYSPNTIIWDVKTNFNVTDNEEEDYEPENYDGLFRGPIILRNALAQSINLPAVKVLYLAGVGDSLDLAHDLGITTLEQEPSFYGLALVLGGGDVKLLDMVSAYGVFATEGMKVSPTAIIKIEDARGSILYASKKQAKRILRKEPVQMLNSILLDNDARAPMFGLYSPLYISGQDVAAKTGTTENYKDAWTMGFASSVVTGVWVGNNNAVAMNKEPGVVLAGPIWNSFMRRALEKYPGQEFEGPEIEEYDKGVLNGEIQGHSILHYVVKDNPQGLAPLNPKSDPQYEAWEQAILDWALGNNRVTIQEEEGSN